MQKGEIPMKSIYWKFAFSVLPKTKPKNSVSISRWWCIVEASNGTDESKIRKNYKRKNIKLNFSLTTALKGINFRRMMLWEQRSIGGMDSDDVSYLLLVKRINVRGVEMRILFKNFKYFVIANWLNCRRNPENRKNILPISVREFEDRKIVYEVSREFVLMPP